MAEKTMYDYLTSATPDSSNTLAVSPQEVLVEDGRKNQIVNMGDDGTTEVITLSNTNIFYVTLRFPRKSRSDIGTVMDFYFDPAKGNGIAKTFRWRHPLDEHLYVVRFAQELTREWGEGTRMGVASVRLKIEGKL